MLHLRLHVLRQFGVAAVRLALKVLMLLRPGLMLVMRNAGISHMRMIYMAVRGVILGGTSGPRAVLQHGTYQETNGRTDEVLVLYFVQTEVGLGGFLATRRDRAAQPRKAT